MTVVAATAMSITLMMNRASYVLLTHRKVPLFLTIDPWSDRVQQPELDDLIIRRTDGSPTYNFCVVVDDWDMEITHVIRGEDHINNTPRQINILKALKAPVPVYAHVSMINGDDGKNCPNVTGRSASCSIVMTVICQKHC